MKKLLSICLILMMSVTLSNAETAPKSNESKNSTTTTCFLTDIDCEGCAKKIMNSIPYQRGVKDVKVDVAKKEVTVIYDPQKNNNENLIKSFDKLKIKANITKNTHK